MDEVEHRALSATGEALRPSLYRGASLALYIFDAIAAPGILSEALNRIWTGPTSRKVAHTNMKSHARGPLVLPGEVVSKPVVNNVSDKHTGSLVTGRILTMTRLRATQRTARQRRNMFQSISRQWVRPQC